MFQWLKDHFIPHEGNDHRPHFLRAPSAALILASVLLLEVAYLAGTLLIFPQSRFLAEVISSVLVEQTNEVRVKDALGTLSPNPLLERAAQIKAQDMAEKGYFSHNTPDGKTPWYFLEEVGYRYQAAGENLAVNFSDSRDVIEAWMRSPGHRANMLNGNYTEIGIATARGTYKGKDAVFVVQYFGKPKFVELPRTATSSFSSEVVEVAEAERLNANVSPVLGAATSGDASPAVVPVALEPNPILIAQERQEGLQDEQAVAMPRVRLDTDGATGSEKISMEMTFAATTTEILVPPAPKLSMFEKAAARILAMPRTIITTVFLSIVILVLLALILTVFIKPRIQHPHLIANAIIIVTIIAAILLLNSLLSQSLGSVF